LPASEKKGVWPPQKGKTAAWMPPGGGKKRAPSCGSERKKKKTDVTVDGRDWRPGRRGKGWRPIPGASRKKRGGEKGGEEVTLSIKKKKFDNLISF